MHVPVMVQEVLAALLGGPPAPGAFLDCTVGTGGHTEAICRAVSGRVVGIDRDAEALQIAGERLSALPNRPLIRQGTFSHLAEVMEQTGVVSFDGILFDLGVSSLHLNDADRGFSFQNDGPLDMRMDRTQDTTASQWLSLQSAAELELVIRRFSQERWARRIATAIVAHQTKTPILRTRQLEQIIWQAVPAAHRHGRIHPATRTFQAIRMAVNHEMEELAAGLEVAASHLAPQGRLVVLSFHSMEDRCVKQAFKGWSGFGLPGFPDRKLINVYKKPLCPGADEILKNPRARSAKLRALQRVA